MSDIVETVRIKSTDPKSQGDFVEINKADFDPKAHKLFGEGDAEGEQLSLDDMTVAELKDYAAAHEIDLGDATLKGDIRAAIDLASGE